jgi:hypothetical protein
MLTLILRHFHCFDLTFTLEIHIFFHRMRFKCVFKAMEEQDDVPSRLLHRGSVFLRCEQLKVLFKYVLKYVPVVQNEM